MLAQLGRKYGPSTLLEEWMLFPDEADSRPKGTDEVADQSETPSEDSELHGGDGQSGECAPQEENSGNGNTGTSDWGSSGSDPAPDNADTGQANTYEIARREEHCQANSDGGTGTEGQGTTSESGQETPDSAVNRCQGSGAGDTPKSSLETDLPESMEGEDNSNGKTDEADELDEPDKGFDCPPQQGKTMVGAEGETPRQQKLGRKSGAKPSSVSNSRFGGDYSTPKYRKADSHLVKKVTKSLAALSGDGMEESSPRRDWTDFLVRLKTYRNPDRARIEEQGRPAIIILVDVSGSCSGFTDKSLPVAYAALHAGVQGKDVIVVEHSNGYPVRYSTRRGEHKMVEKQDEQDDVILWYDQVIAQRSIEVVVAIGDADAHWVYDHLASRPGVSFVWLDNRNCNNLAGPRDKSKHYIEHLAQKPTRFCAFDGCKNEDDFALALDQSCRKLQSK